MSAEEGNFVEDCNGFGGNFGADAVAGVTRIFSFMVALFALDRIEFSCAPARSIRLAVT